MSVVLKNAVLIQDLANCILKKKKVKFINGKPSPNYVPNTVFSRLHEVFLDCFMQM